MARHRLPGRKTGTGGILPPARVHSASGISMMMVTAASPQPICRVNVVAGCISGNPHWKTTRNTAVATKPGHDMVRNCRRELACESKLNRKGDSSERAGVITAFVVVAPSQWPHSCSSKATNPDMIAAGTASTGNVPARIQSDNASSNKRASRATNRDMKVLGDRSGCILPASLINWPRKFDLRGEQP